MTVRAVRAGGCRRRMETNVTSTQGRRRSAAEASRSTPSTQGRSKTGAGATATRAALTCLALLAALALPCTPAGAAQGGVAPLPSSDYTVRPVCAAPQVGYAGCLALELVPKTAAARARAHPLGITRSKPVVAVKASEGDFGLRPADLHSVYQLPNTGASSQTIALVDAYNDLTAEADLKIYDKEFGLPECTGANGCFAQLNQNGTSGKLPFPASGNEREAEEAHCKNETGEAGEAACKEVEEAEGWSEEISLDIQVSHATCENCKIVLIEAESPAFADLEAAERSAVKLGAGEISNSWGGPQPAETPTEDDASAFNHPDTVITAAAGDDGYLNWDDAETSGYADFPATSPHVVAVGGTRLQGPLGPGETWAGETVWNGSGAGGGGCSVELIAPPWQQSVPDWTAVGCANHRAVADVSADADPYTGVASYDSGVECPYEEGGVEQTGHWCTIGGTSLASPLIASAFALAGGANGAAYPAQTLYENASDNPTTLHDVLSGSNGECSKPFNNEEGFAAGTSGCTISEEAAQCSEEPICVAGSGYDGPTGVGTPNGILAFKPVSEEVKHQSEEKRLTEERLHEEEQLHEEERRREEEQRRQEEQRAVERKDETSNGGGPGGAGGGGGTGGGGSSGGVAPPASGSSGGSSGTTVSPGLEPGVHSTTIKLSAFALTPSALLALSHGSAKVSSIHFAFSLSAPSRVRATLAKLVRVEGGERWEPVPGALSFIALKGRNRKSLTARDALAPGRYRLTLTPEHSGARSIAFEIA